MKKKKRQQGFTLVETIVACALLMMLISIFGSITIFTLNLSYREKEASQVEIMADTLANRVDEILRDAEYVELQKDGTEIVYSSPDYPVYYEKAPGAKDTDPLVAKRATLHVPSEADVAGKSPDDQAQAGKLCITYSGKEYPVGYLLLPNDSYEHMTASFRVIPEKSSRNCLYLNITLNGTKYHTSYSRDFTVLLPNC